MIGQKLAKYKFLYLLFFLLAFFILSAFLANSRETMYVFGILFTIIIFASVYVIVMHSKWLMFSAVILAVLTLLGVWTNLYVDTNPRLMIAENILFIAFFLLISLIVMSYVVRDEVVTVNTLCGAVCGYLLIALTWALAYVLILYLNHAAFKIPYDHYQDFETNTQLFIYYSFVTQSTLGFGDITPLTKVAETFSWLQAVTGQIYLTVWIAQLVGLHIANKTAKKESGS